MSVTKEAEWRRIALLEAVQRKGRNGTSSRRVMALQIPTRRGNPA